MIGIHPYFPVGVFCHDHLSTSYSQSFYWIRIRRRPSLHRNISCMYTANKKYLYNIYTMLDQRRRRWTDVVQTLYKCFAFAGMYTPMSHSSTKGCLIVDPSSRTSAQHYSNIGSITRARTGISSRNSADFHWRTLPYSKGQVQTNVCLT